MYKLNKNWRVCRKKYHLIIYIWCTEKRVSSSRLYFSFADCWPERFAATLTQSKCYFSSFSCFVRLASHLPSLLRRNLFSTFRAFWHKSPSIHVIGESIIGITDKTLPNLQLRKGNFNEWASNLLNFGKSSKRILKAKKKWSFLFAFCI